MTRLRAAIIAAAMTATTLVAGSATAQVVGSFVPGGSLSATGYNVVQNFNNCTTAVCSGLTGSNYLITAGNTTNVAAVPNNSGSNYLAVLGGGVATYLLPYATNSIQFDWGTASADNTLTFLLSNGSTLDYTVPNSSVPNGANYNANGAFTATTTGAAQITGLTFKAATNSFELDNISAAVPEPASWGMMILGFGLVGFAMRRVARRTDEKFNAKIKRIAAGAIA